MIVYKKGDIILVSKDEFSDYGHTGLFRVLIGFDAHQQVREAIKDGVKGYPGIDLFLFMPYLVEKGVVAELSYRELHLGSYNEFEISDSKREPRMTDEDVRELRTLLNEGDKGGCNG